MSIPSWLPERKEREMQALLNLRILPDVKRSEVANEDSCPICLLPLGSIFEEHEETGRKEEDSSDLSLDNASGTAISMTGVVKLTSCVHIFCRKDLAEWINSYHGCCPMCRRTFFESTVIDEAEYESSDGGEYIPEDDGDDDGSDDLAYLYAIAASGFGTEVDDATIDENEDELEYVVSYDSDSPSSGGSPPNLEDGSEASAPPIAPAEPRNFDFMSTEFDDFISMFGRDETGFDDFGITSWFRDDRTMPDLK